MTILFVQEKYIIHKLNVGVACIVTKRNNHNRFEEKVSKLTSFENFFALSLRLLSQNFNFTLNFVQLSCFGTFCFCWQEMWEKMDDRTGGPQGKEM